MRPSSWTLLVAIPWLIVSCSDRRSDSSRVVPRMDNADGGAAGENPGGPSNDAGAPETDAGAGGAAGAGAGPNDDQPYCALAGQLDGTRLRTSGEDFGEDFGNLVQLTDQSCLATERGGSDAVFEVQLEEGEQLWVAEEGDLDAVVSIQKSCDPSARCVTSEDEPGDPFVTYTAESDETVYVVVQSYRAEPTPADYELSINIDPACGNGFLEIGEACDDGNNNDSDGCSEQCDVEFAFVCSFTEDNPQSECNPVPSQGAFAGGESIPVYEYSDPLEQDEVAYYLVEFTERVVVNGEISTVQGNPNLSIFDENLELVLFSVVDGPGPNEPIDELGLEPGVYIFEITASRAMPTGFTVTLETRAAGACDDGQLETVFEECDNGGGDGCSNCLVEFGWECTVESPSTCTEIEELGVLGPGSTVLAIEDPAPRASLYTRQWMVTFDVDVLLSGSFGAAGANLLLLEFRDENRDSALSQQLDGGDTFESLQVPAGTYRISAQILGDLPDGGYTLNMTIDP